MLEGIVKKEKEKNSIWKKEKKKDFTTIINKRALKNCSWKL
jgi:hypothetical protein